MCPSASIPVTIAAPAEEEVLREQLDYLIEHAAGAPPQCVCADCLRYVRVRVVLLEIFETEKQPWSLQAASSKAPS